MNFFSEYSRKKTLSARKQMLVGLVIVVVLAAFAAGVLYFINMRAQADRDVAEIQAQLAGTDKIRAQLMAEQRTLSVYRQVQDALESADYVMSRLNYFTADDAREIISAMPEGVKLVSFSLSHTVLDIQGELDSMAVLASLMQNLEDTGMFILVTPAGASLVAAPTGSDPTGQDTQAEDDIVKFSIRCTLEGVPLR